MAVGAWIKMRVILLDEPEVIGIAATCKMEEYAVVGRLLRLWGWADQHTTDGNAPCVTGEWIDRYIQCPGFAAAMEKVGWLVIQDGGVSLPKFDRHNLESGKKRALTANRVAKHRQAGDGNAPSVTEALPGALQPSYLHKQEHELKNKVAGPPSQHLADLMAMWNALPAHIVATGNRVRMEPPSKEILEVYPRIDRDPDIRAALADVGRLREAIMGATFCHGETWFTFCWLFGKTKNRERNAVKLLAGGYVDSTHAPASQAIATTAPVDDFDAVLAKLSPARTATTEARDGQSSTHP